MDPADIDSQEKKPAGVGPMAGTVIIVVLLIAGGVYFLVEQYKNFNTPPIEENLNI